MHSLSAAVREVRVAGGKVAVAEVAMAEVVMAAAMAAVTVVAATARVARAGLVVMVTSAAVGSVQGSMAQGVECVARLVA